VKGYSAYFKENFQKIFQLLEKLIEHDELPDYVSKVVTFCHKTDRVNKAKFLILQARGLLKKITPENIKKVGSELSQVLDEAHLFCQTETGEDDSTLINQIAGIYALRIGFAEKKGNNKEMKFYFDRADPLTSKIVGDPLVTGAIYGCGGRLRMREANFVDAGNYFSKAITEYDSCGKEADVIDCIKLKVLSSLLSGSKVSPFVDSTIKRYAQKNVVKNYERVFKDVLNKNNENFLVNIKPLLRDELVKDYVQPLRRSVQKGFLMDVVRPYTTVSLKFIADKMNSTVDETESMLIELILNSEVRGTIDQASGMLSKPLPPSHYEDYYRPLLNSANTVDRIQRTVLSALG